MLAEVGALLTADPGMPLPRSPGAALSFRPCCRVVPTGPEAMCAPHKPLIHHAVLVGYHHRQVSEATHSHTATGRHPVLRLYCNTFVCVCMCLHVFVCACVCVCVCVYTTDQACRAPS